MPQQYIKLHRNVVSKLSYNYLLLFSAFVFGNYRRTMLNAFFTKYN